MIGGVRLRRALLVASAALAVVATAAAQRVDPWIAAGGGPIDAGAIPEGLRSIDPASCGRCHEDHYREWQSSAHHASFTNAVFLAEFRHRRLPSCERCHAPRGEQAQGVGGAACHVRDGAVWSTRTSARARRVTSSTSTDSPEIDCSAR
jgi:hypothetical protein